VDAATAQGQALGALDRRRAGHRDHQTRPALRAADQPGPMALLFHACGAAHHVPARLEPAARPRRAFAHRHPRPADCGRGHGREQCAVQVARLWRLGDVYRCGRRPGRNCGAVRCARQLHYLPVDHLSHRHCDRRPGIDLGRGLRGDIHPVRAQYRRPDFQGGAVGDLRRVHDRIHVCDAGRRGGSDSPRLGANQGRNERQSQQSKVVVPQPKEGKMSTKHLLVSAAAIVGLALNASAAWAQKKYDTGATDTEIKIGNIMPYSGPAPAYGTIGKAAAAYFKKINDEGGINGRKINFISVDDGYSPPKTVEMARRLVEQDQVLLVWGPLGTPSNTAIQKYMNAKKVPQLHVYTGASKWNDPQHFPWTMGWQPSYQAESKIYAAHILKT